MSDGRPDRLRIITTESFVPDLSKSVHYISWTPLSGLGGYSHLSYEFPIVGEAIGGDPDPIFSLVDGAEEVGTLWPRAPITLMPTGWFSDEEVYGQFADVIEAQRLIGARNMVFDMRFQTYFNVHTHEYDTIEYMYMLYHGLCVLGRAASGADGSSPRVYVIRLTKDGDLGKVVYRRGTYWFTVAPESEVAAIAEHC